MANFDGKILIDLKFVSDLKIIKIFLSLFAIPLLGSVDIEYHQHGFYCYLQFLSSVLVCFHAKPGLVH